MISKPSTEGAFKLDASHVHLMLLQGERVRLVGVQKPDDPTVKIRPHKGAWPLITHTEEKDDYEHAPKGAVVFAVFTEDAPERPWYFAADTSLSVLVEA